MSVSSLGYLGLVSREPTAWAAFASDVLGAEVFSEGETVQVRLDDRHSRVSVTPGEREWLSHLGWEAGTLTSFEAARRRVEAAGVATKDAEAGELAERHVMGMFWFEDLVGFRHEVFYGQLYRPGTYNPQRRHAGFVTGEGGLGHAVLIVPDVDAASAFFQSALGLHLADELVGLDVPGIDKLHFLYTNSRQHSLALMGIAGSRGLHHMMLQTRELDDVGHCLDACGRPGGPEITATLGRHTNDRMVSFYLRTPSGFDIEYGWGGIDVADGERVVSRLASGSVWGHHFTGSPPGLLEAMP